MISNDIQMKLRNQYNPEGSKFRKRQMKIFEILKYVKDVCEKNNIKYWLASGTLLGAVRHGGFRPWDDDVDIEIPVSDLGKFKKCILTDNVYDWHDNSTDSHYWQRFPKIRNRENDFRENAQFIECQRFKGCFVDVFPIEKMPDSFVKPCAFLLTPLVKWHNSNNNLKLFVANLIFRFGQFVFIPFFRMLSLVARNTFFHHTYGVYFPKRRIISNTYETVDIEFEKMKFKAPKDYLGYLETLYGKSYMDLPDESKRTNHS